MTGRVLYLHGFASSPASTKAGFFRERFRGAGIDLEIPDLAAGDFEHLTITGQLEMIQRAARGEPVALLGSSLGGYLAALYAARHAELRKVVMMAPAFCFAKGWAKRLGPEAVAEWKRTGWIDVYHYGVGGTRRLGVQLLTDAEAYEDYPAFAQPALIFHGNRDPVVPVELSEHFVAADSNARLITYPSGHELVDVLEPMWEETRAFLTEPPP